MDLEHPNTLMIAAILENRVFRLVGLFLITERLSVLGAINKAVNAYSISLGI